jgi:hypothetical protein
MPRFKSPDFEKQKGISHFACCSRRGHSRGVRHWFGSLASAQDLSPQPSAAEAAFLKENDAAMTKMMNDMAVKPTGDVDHDFVAMMAPHPFEFRFLND